MPKPRSSPAKIRTNLKISSPGSVLMFLQAMAAFSVLRIHSEIFMSLALAAAVMRWTSSGLNRTGTIRPLASPLGSFGRPIFLGLVGFGTVPELLNDCCLYGGLRRHHGGDIHVSAESLVYGVHVGSQAVRGNLHPIPHAVGDIGYERIGRGAVALPYLEGQIGRAH